LVLRIDQLVQLDSALDRLAQADPRLEQISELRVFGGLEVGGIADFLGASEPTTQGGIRVAKAVPDKLTGPGPREH
jgi:hypothetical protein